MGEIIDSVAMRLGGREFNVPALSLKQVRALMPKIGMLPKHEGEPLTAEHLDAISEIVHAAVSRNYPEITREEIDNLIDLRNAGPAIQAVLGQSGFEAKEGE